MIQIRFAGYGGQGVVRSGNIVGKAAAIYDNKFAAFSQSYGPEARGGACSSQVVVDDEMVLYPYVNESDIFVAMSREAYSKHVGSLKDGGMLLYDVDLVQSPEPGRKIRLYGIPSTRFAEEMGNRIIANVVMLGFFTAVTGVVSRKAIKAAIPETVPSRFVDLNLRAFDEGYGFGLSLLEKEG